MIRRMISVLGPAAAGVLAAVALGATNRAAHPGLWEYRAFYGLVGLAAAVLAWRLASASSKSPACTKVDS